MVVGRCKAAIKRFYFNAATKKCTQFTYGGCEGNANNFDTLEACQQRCGRGNFFATVSSGPGLSVYLSVFVCGRVWFDGKLHTMANAKQVWLIKRNDNGCIM